MPLPVKVRSFFRNLLTARRIDRDLDEEVSAHLDLLIEEKLRSGVPRAEAEHAARLELGGVEQVKEQVRDQRLGTWVHSILADTCYALRQLRKNPAFTAVAILTLALGIGANTAIFSLIDRVLLGSLPVYQPERLVVFKWTAHKSPNTRSYSSYMACPPLPSGSLTPRISSTHDSAGEHGCSFSYPIFEEFRSLSTQFSNVAAIAGLTRLNVIGDGHANTAGAELVTGEFFQTLGVSAALGRPLQPSDDRPESPTVVVLGHAYWQRMFSGEPSVIGKSILLNGASATIVGVAPQRFSSLDPGATKDMWLPVSQQSKLQINRLFGAGDGGHPTILSSDDNWWVYIVGRLAPSVTRVQAQAAADAVFQSDVFHSDATRPLFQPGDAPRLILMDARRAIVETHDRFSRTLTILMVSVALVLLIACSNVASLTLSRTAVRQRELAVRVAIGAGKTHIARQLLTENLLLCLLGGALGLLFAHWTVRALVAVMSSQGFWPNHLQPVLDWRVLGFTLLSSIFTGVLVSIAPMLRLDRIELIDALKGASPSHAVGILSRRSGASRPLVVGQVALSIVLLAGASLLNQTFDNLKKIDPGFDTRNLLLFEIDPTLNRYSEEQTRAFYSRLIDRISAMPGVLSASYSYDPLLSGNLWTSSFHVDSASGERRSETDAMLVGPQFFETLHIPLLAGRTFTRSDVAFGGTASPVVVNQSFVRHNFVHENPIGMHIRGLKSGESDSVIVGVVGDAKNQSLRRPINPTVYVPQAGGSATFEVRTAVEPSSIVPAIRNTVAHLDGNLPVFGIKTQSDQIEHALFEERFIGRLSGFFAALSLLLCCVGLYGLLSYDVACRTSEIGIRIALGAHRSKILWSIVNQGLFLVGVGSIVGIAVALFATRYLTSLLYGVSPVDPLTFISVPAVLLMTAVISAVLPARRATKVDPLVALRYE